MARKGKLDCNWKSLYKSECFSEEGYGYEIRIKVLSHPNRSFGDPLGHSPIFVTRNIRSPTAALTSLSFSVNVCVCFLNARVPTVMHALLFWTFHSPIFFSTLSFLHANRYVNHPQLMRLLDYYENEKYHFLVMKRVTGGELFDRILSLGHYTEADARETFSIVLKGMAYVETFVHLFLFFHGSPFCHDCKYLIFFHI